MFFVVVFRGRLRFETDKKNADSKPSDGLTCDAGSDRTGENDNNGSLRVGTSHLYPPVSG